ncbi:MAG: dihydrolipoamide acetyltransferase family protein, partial [Candidatus Dormibacteria bacterium]
VGEILATEGQRLNVGEPLCTLDGAEEAAGSDPQPRAESPAQADPPPADPEPPLELAGTVPAAAEAEPQEPAAASSPAGANSFISPAVRALAAEHSVDLGQVRGSGFQGRITKRDVLLFLENGRTQSAPPSSAPPGVVAPAAARPGQRLALSPIRRAIAEHMVRSRATSPHAWTMVEVDMSGVARARDAHRERFRATTGVDLTFLHFGMKATCLALRAVPTMNAVFDQDAILLRPEINLGLAVAVPEGLLVPVVKGADRYSVAGLAQAAQPLIERARQGKARLEDVEAGTFTLNNAGALGTLMSQAIINQPQAGILVMDAVVRRPVVVGDAIGIRPMMNLCLSFDHRINDGAQAARFLGAVKSSLEAVTQDTSLF